MKKLALAATLLPATAMAHGDAVPHIHPHGIDITTALLLAIGALVAILAWKRFRD